MKNSGGVIVLVLISAVCMIISLLLISQSHAVTRPEIAVASTSTNKTVTWYTSIPLADANRIANAFRLKKGVDINIIRDSALLIRTRLLDEIGSGKAAADVITIADIGTFVELKNKGFLMKYNSAEYANYSAEDKDPGYWALFTSFGICMAYDSNRINKPPQHWEDILNPEWKGRIGLEDINTAGSQYCQYYMLREKLGTDFWKSLLSVQEPKIFTKTEDLANTLLHGELDLAAEFSSYTVYSYDVMKGTTLKGIYPEEGIPLVITPIAIINSAPHPEEAKILLDFLLSHDGQELTQSLSYSYSLRDDVSPLKGIPSPKTLNILRPKNPAEYGTKRNDYTNEFNSFLETGRRK
jgi:iron(III) transport system substrate-binding protein